MSTLAAMTVLVVVAIALGLVAVFWRGLDRTAGRAVGASFAVATLAPVTHVDFAIAVVTSLGIAVICAAALGRLGLPRASSARLLPLLAMMSWLVLRAFSDTSQGTMAMNTLICLDAAALALVVRHMSALDLHAMTRVFAWIVPFHVAFAVGEQLHLVTTPWPTAGGTIAIEDRKSALIPDLPGRSQSSLGHPIPFAMFLSAAMLLFLHAVVARRRWGYAVPFVLGGAGIALSGTRSAVLSVGVGVLLYTLAQFRLRNAGKYILGSFALLLTINADDLLTALGLGAKFQSSVSYIHRTRVTGSLGALLDRSAIDLGVGNGPSSTRMLFESGVVSGFPGLIYFDNQLISMFALYGLVGVAGLVAGAASALWGGALAIAMMSMIVSMFFSFDALQWHLPFLLFAFTSVLPRRACERLPSRPQRQSASGIDAASGSSSSEVSPSPHDSPVPTEAAPVQAGARS